MHSDDLKVLLHAQDVWAAYSQDRHIVDASRRKELLDLIQGFVDPNDNPSSRFVAVACNYRYMHYMHSSEAIYNMLVVGLNGSPFSYQLSSQNVWLHISDPALVAPISAAPEQTMSSVSLRY
jgi:hypothetical protein